MSKPEMKDKQRVEGVCQCCGRDGFHDEEAHEAAEELQDGWLVLSDVTAQVGGVYGEWCSGGHANCAEYRAALGRGLREARANAIYLAGGVGLAFSVPRRGPITNDCPSGRSLGINGRSGRTNSTSRTSPAL